MHQLPLVLCQSLTNSQSKAQGSDKVLHSPHASVEGKKWLNEGQIEGEILREIRMVKGSKRELMSVPRPSCLCWY